MSEVCLQLHRSVMKFATLPASCSTASLLVHPIGMGPVVMEVLLVGLCSRTGHRIWS